MKKLLLFLFSAFILSTSVSAQVLVPLTMSIVDVVEVTQASPNPVTIYDFCYTDHVHINSPLNLVEPLRRNINMIRHIVGGS